MTNAMLYKANRLLQEEIKKKDMDELYDILNTLTKRKDNRNVCRAKNPLPCAESFKKSVDRLTLIPKKEDSKYWSLQITENTLFVLKAMVALDVPLKKFVKEVTETDTVVSEAPSENDRILSGIEDIKNLLSRTGVERYSLNRRFEFLWNTLNSFCVYGFLSREMNIEFVANLPPYRIYWYNLLNKFTPTKKLSKGVKDGIRILAKQTNSVSCFNICFLYKIIEFAIDLMEKYESTLNAKTEKPLLKNFENPAMPKFSNKLFLIGHLRKNRGLMDKLIIKFALASSEFFFDKDILFLTNKLLQIELQLIFNILNGINKNVVYANSVMLNDLANVSQTDYWISNILAKNLEHESSESNNANGDTFISQYDELLKRLDIKKEVLKIELDQLQQNALGFIKRAWKTNITPIIATGMGTGKTRIACQKILDILKENPFTYKYILAIVPANVIAEWTGEMYMWNMEKPVVIQGNGREKKLEQGFEEQIVYITTYDCIANDIGYYLQKPPLFIIYDELHQVNNSEQIQEKFYSLAELNSKVEYRLALTGTPAQNSVNEFYMNYCFFNEQEKYLPIIKEHHKREDFLASETERKKLRERMFSRYMYFFDRNDSPKFNFKINYNVVPVAMCSKHLQSVKLLEKRMVKEDKIRQYALAPTICDFSDAGICTTTESSKINFVISIINEKIMRGEKVVVFSYYTRPIIRLYKLFNRQAVLEVGDNAIDKKSSYCCNITEFTHGKRQILLTTIKKSGTGVNLDIANNLVLLEMWWNPMAVLQSLHRIIRKNQTKNVNIYMPIYFVETSQNHYRVFSLEKKLWESMERKIRAYNEFLDELANDARSALESTKEGNSAKTDVESLTFAVENIGFGKKTLPIYKVLNELLILEAKTTDRKNLYNSHIVDRIEKCTKIIEKSRLEKLFDTDTLVISDGYANRFVFDSEDDKAMEYGAIEDTKNSFQHDFNDDDFVDIDWDNL